MISLPFNPARIRPNPSRENDGYSQDLGVRSRRNGKLVRNVSKVGVTDFEGAKSIYRREICLSSIYPSRCHTHARAMRVRTRKGVCDAFRVTDSVSSCLPTRQRPTLGRGLRMPTPSHSVPFPLSVTNTHVPYSVKVEAHGDNAVRRLFLFATPVLRRERRLPETCDVNGQRRCCRGDFPTDHRGRARPKKCRQSGDKWVSTGVTHRTEKSASD
jgi:hypothetical protein